MPCHGAHMLLVECMYLSNEILYVYSATKQESKIFAGTFLAITSLPNFISELLLSGKNVFKEIQTDNTEPYKCNLNFNSSSSVAKLWAKMTKICFFLMSTVQCFPQHLSVYRPTQEDNVQLHRRKFSPPSCSHWRNFCIADMVTFTALAKFYPLKITSQRQLGLAKNLSHENFQLYSGNIAVIFTFLAVVRAINMAMYLEIKNFSNKESFSKSYLQKLLSSSWLPFCSEPSHCACTQRPLQFNILFLRLT